MENATFIYIYNINFIVIIIIIIIVIIILVIILGISKGPYFITNVNIIVTENMLFLYIAWKVFPHLTFDCNCDFLGREQLQPLSSKNVI